MKRVYLIVWAALLLFLPACAVLRRTGEPRVTTVMKSVQLDAHTELVRLTFRSRWIHPENEGNLRVRCFFKLEPDPEPRGFVSSSDWLDPKGEWKTHEVEYRFNNPPPRVLYFSVHHWAGPKKVEFDQFRV